MNCMNIFLMLSFHIFSLSFFLDNRWGIAAPLHIIACCRITLLSNVFSDFHTNKCFVRKRK